MSSRPDPKSLINEESFLDYVKGNVAYNVSGGVRSTAAINGTQQYAATTHSSADVLMGSFYQRNPQDQLLVVNQALTESVSSLVKGGSGVHAFSSFSQVVPSESLLSGSDGSGGTSGGTSGGGYTQNGSGSVLNETWVNSLPLQHQNGALIWTGQGKASLEMHLPTDADIKIDEKNHLQDGSLPTEWRHPYNMDRVDGDGAGGNKPSISANHGYTVDWGGGENLLPNDKPRATLGYENPEAGGTQGAFGYLDPESEQYYMAMAWPYNSDSVIKSFTLAGRTDMAAAAKELSKSDYRHKRILVYHKPSGLGCVCTPGDWGSQPYWSNGSEGFNGGSIEGHFFGLAPDVHHYFGTTHGSGDQFKARWVPDDTPLGPYTARNSNEGSVPSQGAQGVQVPVGSGEGSALQNTLEEMKYAGEKVANHPNLYFDDTFKESIINGNTPQPGWERRVTPAYFPEMNRIFYFPSLLNYIWIILEAGFTLRSNGRGYVQRNKRSSSSLSNHATGGAWDIYGIGNGRPPKGPSTEQWISDCEALWLHLSKKPKNTKPDEVGGDPTGTFGGWFYVYPDADHIHIGFNLDRVGTLIPALKRAQAGSAVNAR